MALQLVPLPEVERLSPVCIRLLGGNPSKFTLQGTNTYLIGRGPKRLLIDTGEGKPSWIAALQRTLAEEGASVSAALITHWHGDHVGGIKDVLGLEGTAAKVYKHQPDEGQIEIQDGQRFEVEGATVTAHHTPGHTVDHMIFVLEEEDAMFTGDNVLGQGTGVFEDLATYLSSLEMMGPLFKGRAYPGHGPVIDDGPGKIREYIQHRQQREEQITQTLRSVNEAAGTAAWEPMELVRVIYADVPENLHIPAQGGVMHVLQKLAREGRAQEGADGRWVLRDRPAL
ncbi:Metallo-hydrolase/oxidoreductase [Cryphonectria parasitica EP155]|uniref:Metallo-hydrolase/oxidoreductase n=1 Tax=Cryphonectria parasitica (strain ATCC 38755 / EP155) TaxID=660469 RepID=A0A9P5CMX1_CRYP1|nr:Metallo-hydrolase/oxidoreductase [Cryphonectria parasitica EP155]KAF3763697.1 Metallo-hydrolase/oxidoreductase [Cryphonectria parasitica EP155]